MSKIAFLSNSSYIGGAELCMLETIKALKIYGIEVHVIFPSEGPLIDKVKPYAKSISIVHYDWWVSPIPFPPLLKFKFIWGILKGAFLITKVLKKNQITRVITNDLSPTPAGALAAYFSNIKHTWYIHAFGKEDHNLSFIYGTNLSCRIMDLLSQNVIANSNVVFKKFQKYFPAKISTLYYAVDSPRPANAHLTSDDNRINMLIVGRIAEGKRQEDAVKALAILREKGYNTYLKVLGYNDSDYYAYLKKLVEEKNMNAYVGFIPFNPKPFDIIESSDILLVCSVFEAFGRVTIEGMKAGKAVVASDTGASPEIIKDGWNGLLYKCKDEIDLADKIERLIVDEKLRKEIANNAYHWSWENFNLEKHGRELVKILEK